LGGVGYKFLGVFDIIPQTAADARMRFGTGGLFFQL
jgi:hypothetical protein